MSHKHAHCPSETSTDQPVLQRDAALEKVPASALPTLSGMFKHAPLIARVITRLTLDKYEDMLIDYALVYLIGSPIPEVMPEGYKATIAASVTNAAKWIWYGVARHLWARRCW